MKAWWHYFKAALTPAECDWLIGYALTMEPMEATIGHGGKSIVDTSFRRSRVRWLNKADPAIELLIRKIENMLLKANANSFGFDVSGFHELQFTEYSSEDEGTYNWHTDNNWKKDTPFDRKISMVIQLSDADSYTGGRLLLENDPLPEDKFRNQGDVVFFPSFNKHTVTPVKLGKRYSLVTWAVGPKFR
jgi:PKHD-type hydroxylase